MTGEYKDERIEPLISVVVPYYNGEQYLANCIESIVKQSYQKLEILLINNCSNDRSERIAQEYACLDDRIRCENCDTQGLAATRNYALEHASGEFLMFVDCDDLLANRAVQLMYQVANARRADLVQGAYIPCFVDRMPEHVVRSAGIFDSYVKEEIHGFYLRQGRNFNQAWGKLYHRSVLEQIHYAEGKLYEDIAVLPQILEHVEHLVAIDVPIYAYRMHGGSLIHAAYTDHQIDGLTARMENVAFYRRLYPKLEEAAVECAMEFGFYLLGRIMRGEKSEHMASWNYTLGRIEEAKAKVVPGSLVMRVALLITSLNPELAGYLFAWYSRIKNHTK